MLFGLVVLLTAACGSHPTEPQATSASEPESESESESESGATCQSRLTSARAVIDEVLRDHSACAFDVDCVAAPIETACLSDCDVALHPRGLEALGAAARSVATEHCLTLSQASCAPVHSECARATPRCTDGRCVMEAGDAPLREMAVPPENAAARSDDPPARPAPAAAEDERARRLFAAIVHDEPERASDFFFPREAFAVVKAMADPDGYWWRLYARYAADIHALHQATPNLDRAEYGRLEIIRRGGWVKIRDEGNALPYWVARHNVLHYTVDGEEHTLEVRVMITWGERWYVTHLSEFH